MPNFVRWLFAALSSIVVAGLIFVLATVGIVVAFFVFIGLFIFISLAMRRGGRENRPSGRAGSSRIIVYTNIPRSGSAGEADGREGIPEETAVSGAATRPQDNGCGARKPDNGETSGQDGDVYDLSPDEYTVEETPAEKKPRNAKPDDA